MPLPGDEVVWTGNKYVAFTGKSLTDPAIWEQVAPLFPLWALAGVLSAGEKLSGGNLAQ